MAAVTVSWSTVGPNVVRIRYSAGTDLIAWDRFATVPCLPPAAVVYTYYDCGPTLVGRLADLLAAGYINRVVVRAARMSPTWLSTVVDGTTKTTIDLWRYRNLATIMNHPVITRLGPYVPNGMIGAWSDLITTTFDPRWYFRPDRPNRLSRLESAFGLQPGFDSKPSRRRQTVRSCWVGKSGEPSTDHNDFFGRRHSSLLAAGVPEPVAVRRVGRHFLRAFVAAWLHKDTGGDPLFDPTRLFDRAAVEAAIEG